MVFEDGIPEILAEQRLGHEVPGMRGLYAHAPTGCAPTSEPPCKPGGKTLCAPELPSTRTRPCRCSTSCWHHSAILRALKPGTWPCQRQTNDHRHTEAGRMLLSVSESHGQVTVK
jgi:hypothetical protein